MSVLDLDALEALEQAATKAPWSSMPDIVEGQPNWIIGQEDDPNDGYYGTTDVLRIADDNLDGNYLSDQDAEFIAAIRNAAPALITAARERDKYWDAICAYAADVSRLERENNELRARIDAALAALEDNHGDTPGVINVRKVLRAHVALTTPTKEQKA